MEEDRLRQEIRRNIEVFFNSKGQKRFIPGKTKIQYSGPVYDEEEVKAIMEAILDGWFGVGKRAHEFQRRFAEFLGVEETILTNSGSSANLLAISALMSPQFHRRLSPGDEVIVSALSFPTTFNPIIQNGLFPVVLDIELGTYNIDVGQLEEAVSPRTKAIMLLHNLGNPCDMDAVMALAEKYEIFLVEDNCDALGAKFDGRLTGTFGLLSTLSFYVAHHITMGEGGAVCTSHEDLAKIVLSLRDWGRACPCPICVFSIDPNATCKLRFRSRVGILPPGYDTKYLYTNIGYNFKPLEFQAAMGLVQLQRLPKFIEERKANFQRLYAFFQGYEDFFILPRSLPKAEPSPFAFPLTLKDGAPFTRRELVTYYEECNIETRLFFSGNIVRHPAYLGLRYRPLSDLANADKVMRDGFFLGVYPGITAEMMDYALNKTKEFLERFAVKRGSKGKRAKRDEKG